MSFEKHREAFLYLIAILLALSFLVIASPNSFTGFVTVVKDGVERTIPDRGSSTPITTSTSGLTTGARTTSSSSDDSSTEVNLWTMNKQPLKMASVSTDASAFPGIISTLLAEHTQKVGPGRTISVNHVYCNVGSCTTGTCVVPTSPLPKPCTLKYGFKKGGKYVGGSGLKLSGSNLLAETNCNGKTVAACQNQVIGTESLLKYVLKEEYVGPGGCTLADEDDYTLTIRCCGTPTGC